MNHEDGYQPSAGAAYLWGSVPLFVVGAMLMANVDEEPEFFRTAGVLALAFAVYLLLVGAVARGIQVARRSGDA